ncbi:MAG: polysaccharide deacetylase family protein [Deltaproteobacteria bacterium]
MPSDTTYVLITIDAEPSSYKGRPLPIDKMVYGRFGREQFGISKIMDLCEKYGFRATFFVDVCPYKHYGEDTLKEICLSIHSRGHDVELHTHPNWTRGRYWMFEYTLEEQTEIIREGLDLIHKWIGLRPVAYRAGGFSADMNTLAALAQNNIILDSSFYPGYKRCPLTSPPMMINSLSKHGGVVEMPVTVFTPLKVGGFESYRYIDVDSCTWSELKFAIDDARRNKINPITLMLHSFSFVKWNAERTEFSPDYGDLERFERALQFLKASPGVEVVTARDFLRIYGGNPELFPSGQTGFIPNTGFMRTFARACLRFGSGWKNKALVSGAFLSLAVLGYSLWKAAF